MWMTCGMLALGTQMQRLACVARARDSPTCDTNETTLCAQYVVRMGEPRHTSASRHPNGTLCARIATRCRQTAAHARRSQHP